MLSSIGDQTMGEEALYQAIFKRKSVRNYEKAQLDAATLSEIGAFLKTIRPMVPGIQTEMRIIDSSKVKGMFKVDAPHFLAFFSEVKEGPSDQCRVHAPTVRPPPLLLRHR